MKLAILVGYILIVSQILAGQSVLDLSDRQEMVHENRILRRTDVDPVFAPIPGLPEIRPNSRFLGRADSAWDGSRIYQVELTEDRRRVVTVGNLFYTSSGEQRWFWTEPKPLPLNGGDDYLLLGAWEENLLFLQTHREMKPKVVSAQTLKADSQSLIRLDLITGNSTSLMNLQSGNDLRSTAIFSKHAFYLFTATGKVARVDVRTEPWGVDDLNSNFWAAAGVNLCKETGQFRNPFLFGKAFLDLDGSILIPAQVFLPLNREDIDLAWSKLPQIRKAELISSGMWPVPPGKEIGWKDDVCFLKFDPLTSRFKQINKSRFENLVIEEDKNFIIHRFRNIDPNALFTTIGEKILQLDEAMRLARPLNEATPKGKPLMKGTSSVVSPLPSPRGE